MLQRWLANSPPMVVHTERSSFEDKPPWIHTESLRCGSYRGVTVHVVILTWVSFQGVSPVSFCQSDSLTRGDGGCFLRESLGWEDWTSRWFLFVTNTQWVKVFCQWQALFFGQKCDEESVGQTEAYYCWSEISPLREFHSETEAGNWRTKATSKRQCEWG